MTKAKLTDEQFEKIEGWIDNTAKRVIAGQEDLMELGDLKQQGWLIALESFEKFDPEGGSSLQSWILQDLKRDLYRYADKQRQERLGHDNILDWVDVEDGPDELLDYDEQDRIADLSDLAKLLETCSEREANVLDLLYFHDLPEREVAAELGVSRAMVRKIHDRALKKMREVGCPDE